MGRKKKVWNRDSKPGGELTHMPLVFFHVLPSHASSTLQGSGGAMLTKLSLFETTGAHTQEDPAMLENE